MQPSGARAHVAARAGGSVQPRGSRSAPLPGAPSEPPTTPLAAAPAPASEPGWPPGRACEAPGGLNSTRQRWLRTARSSRSPGGRAPRGPAGRRCKPGPQPAGPAAWAPPSQSWCTAGQCPLGSCCGGRGQGRGAALGGAGTAWRRAGGRAGGRAVRRWPAGWAAAPTLVLRSTSFRGQCSNRPPVRLLQHAGLSLKAMQV